MEIQQVVEKKTLMIRTTTPLANLSRIMGELYGEIASYMHDQGIPIEHAPYAMYYNMDMDALDVEVGFPITGDALETDSIKIGLIPGGTIATAIHTGPYTTMEKTYGELMEFIKQNNCAVHESWMYEYYLNSPMDTPEELLQTQICYIVL